MRAGVGLVVASSDMGRHYSHPLTALLQVQVRAHVQHYTAHGTTPDRTIMSSQAVLGEHVHIIITTRSQKRYSCPVCRRIQAALRGREGRAEAHSPSPNLSPALNLSPSPGPVPSPSLSPGPTFSPNPTRTFTHSPSPSRGPSCSPLCRLAICSIVAGRMSSGGRQQRLSRCRPQLGVCLVLGVRMKLGCDLRLRSLNGCSPWL